MEDGLFGRQEGWVALPSHSLSEPHQIASGHTIRSAAEFIEGKRLLSPGEEGGATGLSVEGNMYIYIYFFKSYIIYVLYLNLYYKFILYIAELRPCGCWML
jgi:hypothetical protein